MNTNLNIFIDKKITKTNDFLSNLIVILYSKCQIKLDADGNIRALIRLRPLDASSNIEKNC